MQWKKTSSDPNNNEAKQSALSELKGKFKGTSEDLLKHVIDKTQGKRVLDIGIVEHCAEYWNSERWRHKLIARSAGYCLGIDILESEIRDLKENGYNVIVADATSGNYLGEKFDVIFIGDVIEHVDDPVKLMRFSIRHLSPNGVVIVTTPNPHCISHVFNSWKNGTFVGNLDHVRWISPCMALELANRSDCELIEWRGIKHRARAINRPIKWAIGAILGSSDLMMSTYVFAFAHRGQ